MLTGEIAFAASPAVIMEYEDVVKRPGLLGDNPWISRHEIDTILDVICAKAIPSLPWFRFRPFLNDPKDDLYIECALSSAARTIVTDDKDFRHAAMAAFGLTAITARDFVAAMIRERRPT
jgi:predicted nucleic acid-binding protein